MYFNNKMFKARAQTAYWQLMNDAKIEYTIKHDPTKLTCSGRNQLRTWMRSGYCDSPNGTLGARWLMLMLSLKADYLFEQPVNGCFQIRFIDRDGVEIVRRNQFESINALFLIYAKYKGWQLPGGLPLVTDQWREQWVIDGWGSLTRSLGSAGGHFEYRTRYEPHLLRAIVRELGHPLGDKARIDMALAAIDRPVEFKVTAREFQGAVCRDYTLNFQQLEETHEPSTLLPERAG